MNEETTNQNSTDKGMGYEPMLAAAADSLRKFVWVGWNKNFKQYWISEPLTTRQLLEIE